MNKFIKQLIKEIQDENTSVAEDGISSAEFDGYIDTGSFIFNAQLSGSLKGGLPNNKTLALAGAEAVGKTFFALGMAKNFLDNNKEAFVLWYLAEPAVTKKMLEERGIDAARVLFAEPDTVQEWTFHMIRTLDAYTAEEKHPPMLIVIDSLGALSTSKELSDTAEGKEVEDMTRAKKIKAAFRMIDKKLAKAKVPLIVTNHTYKEIGLYPKSIMSGGSGLKYAGDAIAFLTASKDKEGDGAKAVVKGNIIHITMAKNRFAQQFTKTEVLLSYETGLDRYYGLMELAEKYEIVKRHGSWYETPDGSKVQKKDMTPQFWDNHMELLELAANQEFKYGSSTNEPNKADLESATTQ